jgi:hypothetical protein
MGFRRYCAVRPQAGTALASKFCKSGPAICRGTPARRVCEYIHGVGDGRLAGLAEASFGVSLKDETIDNDKTVVDRFNP